MKIKMKIQILKEKYKLDLVFCIIGRLVRWGSVLCPFAQGQREGKGKERRGLGEWKKKRGSREQNRKKTKNAGEMVSAIGDQKKTEA